MIAIVSKLVLSLTKELDEGETRRTGVKDLLLYIGFIIMSVSTICLYTIFFKAYLNPDKYTLVTVDTFGEADVELIVLSIVAPCVVYFFYHIRKYRKTLSRVWKLSPILFLLLPIYPVGGLVLIPDERDTYLSNYPMQRSTGGSKDIVWIFSVKNSTSTLTVLPIRSLERYSPISPIDIAENILPHNFDVCMRFDDILIVTFSEKTQSLNMIWMETVENSTFIMLSNAVIVPSKPGSRYTNPSIAIDENGKIYITYFDTSDGHLYVLENIDDTKKQRRVSQEPAKLYYSKITHVGNNVDMMILYSHDNILESATCEPSRISGRRVICITLSWSMGWSLVPNKVDPGPAIVYHKEDTSITFRRWDLEVRQWKSYYDIAEVGDQIAPLISISQPGDFSVVWNEPSGKVFYNAMGYDVPWDGRIERISADKSISVEHISAYLVEYADHIGIIYTTSSGLSFVYTGDISDVVGGKRTPMIVRLFSGFVLLAAVFVLLKKILLEGEA